MYKLYSGLDGRVRVRTGVRVRFWDERRPYCSQDELVAGFQSVIAHLLRVRGV